MSETEVIRDKTVPGLSPAAARIMNELVVVRGLGYVEAIRRCEQEAEAAAAPWREVASVLRRSLSEGPYVR